MQYIRNAAEIEKGRAEEIERVEKERDALQVEVQRLRSGQGPASDGKGASKEIENMRAIIERMQTEAAAKDQDMAACEMEFQDIAQGLYAENLELRQYIKEELGLEEITPTDGTPTHHSNEG